MTERRPVTLITGASAGIGVALAHVFARNGHELLLVARREQRIAALADHIAAQGRPRPSCLALDLARDDACERLTETMATLGVEPDIVVNNAGFGLLGKADALSRTEQLGMVDVNIRALTELSLAFVDGLIRRRGAILNVASIAGFMPGPRMAIYFASKAYVLSFSEALHHELKQRGVRVCALCPGPVSTEFQERAGFVSEGRSNWLALSAEAVAEQGYRGLRSGKRVVVPGFGNKMVTALARFIPHGMVMTAIGRHNRRHGRR